MQHLGGSSLGLVGTGAGVVVTVWQVVIWTAGLQGRGGCGGAVPR